MASDAVVNLIINAADAESEVNAQLRRIANDAENRAPRIDLRVDIDNASVVRALNRLDTQTNDSLGRINDTIGEGFSDLTAQLSAQLDLLGDHLSGIADNTDDISRAMRELDRAGSNALGDVDRHARDADDSTNRLGDTFGRMGRSALTAVTSAARLGLIGSLASTALVPVAGLGAALANIAPAATAGVAAFATLKIATTVLKVALTGVSDAISQVFSATADPEALAAALERLSPEARSFVLELQRMKPALDDLRIDVQDRLFQGLDTSLRNLSTATFPALRTAALSFSGTFNEMARSAAKGATSLSEQGVVGQALKSSSGAFANLSKVPGQVLVSIIRLANAGGPLLNKLTSGIANAVTNISKNLATAQQSGALKTAVDGAVTALKQLGRIASNVFGALGNIFSIASEAGGGLFGSLEKITQALEDLTATTGFRDTLTALIETGQVLLSTILPLLGEAFRVIGPVIQELAPPVQMIIGLLGEQFSSIIAVLGPIIGLVAEAFGNLLIALSPLITAAGELIVAILPVLTPLFEALNEIIVALTPIISLLVTELVDAMLPVIKELIPVIKEFAEFIARVVVALAPLVEELVPLAVDVFTRWWPVIAEVLKELTPLIGGILDFVASLIEKLIPAIKEAIEWATKIGEKFSELAGEVLEKVVLPALRSVSDFLNGNYRGAWENAKKSALSAVGITVLAIGDLSRQVSGLMQRLSVQIGLKAAQAMDALSRAFRNGKEAAVRIVAGLGVAAVDAVQGLVVSFYSAGQNIMDALGRGILSKVNSAVSAVAEAAAKIASYLPHSPAKTGPFSGRGYPLYAGQAIMDSLAQGITSRSGSVGAAMNSALSGSGFGTPGLTTGTAGGTQNANALGALAGSGFGRISAPNVAVYLGNELLTDRMHKVVVDENSARDRQASQGVRF